LIWEIVYLIVFIDVITSPKNLVREKKMEVVYESDYAIVRAYPETKIVHHEIKKFIFGEHFKDMMLKGAEAFEKYQCTKWLSDDRHNSALRPEDRQWGEEVWEPRIIESGWKAWALVMPEKVIGQMNMKQIVERYASMGIEVKAFTDPEEALTWLKGL